MKSIINRGTALITLALVTTHSSAITVVPVPEPSSFALLGAGLAVLAISRRSK